MAVSREMVVNLLDLLAFGLVTPEIIGKERLDQFGNLIGLAWGAFVDNQGPTLIVSVIIIFAIVWFSRRLPPENRQALYASAGSIVGLCGLLGGWFTALGDAFIGIPMTRIMLLLGAIFFVSARIINIYAAQRKVVIERQLGVAAASRSPTAAFDKYLK